MKAMKISREEKKEKAIKIMNTLDIYKQYIKGFKDSDKVCFFENFGGYWVDQEPEIEKKIKAIEGKYNCLVYAITHEYTEFGECYDFLLVTDYKCERNSLIEEYQGGYAVFAYVWNKDDDWCSELGTIAVKSFGCGIRRFAYWDILQKRISIRLKEIWTK